MIYLVYEIYLVIFNLYFRVNFNRFIVKWVKFVWSKSLWTSRFIVSWGKSYWGTNHGSALRHVPKARTLIGRSPLPLKYLVDSSTSTECAGIKCRSIVGYKIKLNKLKNEMLTKTNFTISDLNILLQIYLYITYNLNMIGSFT